jgi:glutathione S-transferase
MPLTFYFAPGSSSLAAHVALEEAQAPYCGERVLLANGAQRREEFLAINPHGRIPVLVAEGQAITENIAILTYIAHRFPQAHLLPLGEPLLLARAYELMSWFASTVHVAIAQIWRTERYTDVEDLKPALAEFGRTVVANAFAELERALSASAEPWLLGETYSVVDAYAFVLWRWAQRLELGPAQYPIWAEHADRLGRRPAVLRALAKEGA